MWLEPLPVDNHPSCGQLDLTTGQGAAFAALDDEPLVEDDEDDDVDEEEDDELPLDESEDFELDEDESELLELAAAGVLVPDSERLSVR
jgi:hypothetical protein